MEDDQAATAFVEICARLDRLIAAQELTNSVLLRLAATYAKPQPDVLAVETVEEELPSAAVYPVSGIPRGLGSLIPRN
ncbi:MAG: hypothetical protein QOJ03_1977 [Frankiaceae bacterium]|jgi:hypothetical protein|nr:hypothetical protein [Frankiaceae bacterium]